MSYILDALKKSEQERARGAVPDIRSLHQPKSVEAPKRYHWQMVIVIVLVLNAGGIGYWFYQQYKEKVVSLVVSSTDGDDASSSDNSLPGDNLAGSEQQLDRPAQAPIEQVSIPVSASSEQPGPAETTTSTQTLVQRPRKPQEPDSSKKAAKPSVVFSDEPITVSAEELQNAEKAVTTAALSDVQIKVESESPAPAIDEKIYNISDLPEDIKRELPSISFAGHVYSSSEAQRSVMINGNKMREGQEVSKDLILDQITQEGAVFRYQGYRFKLGALQDWSFQ